MCIGIPMKVIKTGFGYALCEGLGQQKEVNTLLTGDVDEGTWVLVFLSSAREILTEHQANKITQALKALDDVMANPESLNDNNTALDPLFADLVNREIIKPASDITLPSDYSDKKH